MALRLNLILLVALLVPQAVSGQMKLVPKERLMEVSSPRHCADSAFLRFDRTECKIEMNESDSPDTIEFKVTNTGTESILISRLVSTCSCLTAECGTKLVKTGETARIRAIYNPKGHPGRFVRKIFIYTGENRNPAAIQKVNAFAAAKQ